MESLQIILLVLVFLTMALSMFFRKIPALIALPLMAFLIALIGGIRIDDIFQYVIGQGSLKLYNAYTIAMFGSMLSVILQRTGVAESFIKKGAELSGDNPWVIAVIMLCLIILLFTTLGGLGAIIMVATIVLPIMASVGIGQMTVVGIFLIGLSIGGTLNVGNWAVYISVMGLSVDEIRPFALIMFSITFIAALIYITIQLYNDGHDLKLKKIIILSIISVVIVSSLSLSYFYLVGPEFQQSVISIFVNSLLIIKWIIAAGIISLFVHAVYRAVFINTNDIHWGSYFTPVIPLFLILLFNLDFIAAFIIGLIFCFISTYKKDRLNLFVRAIFDGGAVVMPAVALMFGIGMLLNSIMGPGIQLPQYAGGWPVLNLLRPLMAQIIPGSPLMYVILFTLIAPLALYRGPLNVWGMGYGLAAVFLASGLNPGAVMGLLLAVGQIQGISDPTNTHNVWLANEMQVNVQKVLWNTIPYTWILAFLGLIVSALMFM